MQNEKLYCPPTGTTPEPLPDYCRFFNGVIRTDLQTLDDDELNAWGWEGPFVPPTILDNLDNLDEISEELKSGYEYNEDSQKWKSVNKVVWFSRERRYIILHKDEDSSEYEIPYRTNRILPSGTEVSSSPAVSSNSEPVHQLPPILWKEFRTYLVSSLEFNEYIAALMNTFPIIASSFPVAILQLQNGSSSSFESLWKVLKDNDKLPPQELIDNLKLISSEFNLPRNFIQILGE